MSAKDTETTTVSPEGKTEVEPTEPEPVEVEQPASEQGDEESPPQRRLAAEPEADHRSKFRVVYLVLAAVVVAAVLGLVALLSGSDSESEGAWSSWRPVAEEPLAQAQEIANQVGAAYRLPSGSQLAYVQAEEPQVQNIPVAAVAIRTAPGGQTFTGEGIPVFPAEETIVYILCGLGQECAIEEGEPSEERQRLLRREALELALYTFQYIDDIDYVVAFLPPRAGYRPTYALFFQRPELESLLDQPLRETLPAAPPPLPDEIPPTEVGIIDGLTQPRFFAFAFQQLQDGQAVMVLEDPNRVPPPEPIEPAETETAGTDGATGTDGTDGTGGTTETDG